jgi:hopene-associated glycosyltransferase HpnB
MALTIVAAVPVVIWLYLLTARGGFWRIDRQFPDQRPRTLPEVTIVAVIPARDEAECIGEAVRSLLGQQLRRPIHIIVVDDGSSDGTADEARQAAEQLGMSDYLTVIHGQPLAAGWTGKLWAVSQGVAHAERFSPDYLLLTDADIRHEPWSITRLIFTAENRRCDLASCMVKLATDSTAEKALIPAFVYFFLQLYPPRWVHSPKRKTAAAAGGCVLIRPHTLGQIGGISAIRDQVIDDCALARTVKRNGGRVWLGLTDESQSIRSYGGFSGVTQMIARSAFNQLRHSSFLLASTLAGLFLTYCLPPLLLLSRRPWPMTFGGIAWVLMTVTYWPMVRFYRQAGLRSLLLPGIAVFYAMATVQSAFRYWGGAGGIWKGRIQDARRP